MLPFLTVHYRGYAFLTVFLLRFLTVFYFYLTRSQGHGTLEQYLRSISIFVSMNHPFIVITESIFMLRKPVMFCQLPTTC